MSAPSCTRPVLLSCAQSLPLAPRPVSLLVFRHTVRSAPSWARPWRCNMPKLATPLFVLLWALRETTTPRCLGLACIQRATTRRKRSTLKCCARVQVFAESAVLHRLETDRSEQRRTRKLFAPSTQSCLNNILERHRRSQQFPGSTMKDSTMLSWRKSTKIAHTATSITSIASRKSFLELTWLKRTSVSRSGARTTI